jgi:SNF2 family DNA or RNA helicase
VNCITQIFPVFYFLATGKQILKSYSESTYGYLLQALIMLYKGEYEASCKMFAKSLLYNNKDSKESGVYENPYFNYFYTLALLLANTPATQKKLETLTHKKTLINDHTNNYCLLVLINYFTLRNEYKSEYYVLKGLFEYATDQTTLFLAYNMCDFMHKIPPTCKKIDTSPANQAFLQLELSRFGDTDNEKIQAIKKDVGGDALLTRLTIKESWQLALESIINKTNDKTSSNSNEKEQRIIYIIGTYDIEALLQSKKKNGEWSIGKRITDRAIENKEIAIADKTDQKILNSIASYKYLHINNIIYLLVGCDRVFKRAPRGQLQEIKIVEEKPYLIVNKNTNGTFKITSNIPYNKIPYDNTPIITKSDNNCTYTISKLSMQEATVYKQLLSISSYPAAAEPLIKQMLVALGGKTELHSNINADLDDIDNIEGDSRVVVRLLPQKGLFEATISVAPLKESDVRDKPGQGSINLICNDGNKKVQVTRNLKQEKKNLSLLREFLCQAEMIDEDNSIFYLDKIILSFEDVLQLLDWCREHDNNVSIEWKKGSNIKVHPAIEAKSVSIGVKSKGGWFEVEGDVKIDDSHILKLQELIKLMSASSSHYIRLGESEYVQLSNELRKQLKRLAGVSNTQHDKILLAPAATSLLDGVFDSEMDVNTCPALDKLRKQIKESSTIRIKTPTMLKATLREYQEEGYTWMARLTAWGAGVCLADDMGLGKTVQTIALLLDQQKKGASLIVAPASVIPNWRNELNKFAPTLHVDILNDSNNRKELIEKAKKGDIVLSTYGILTVEQENLAQKEWNIVCLDEAHVIKNRETKMSQAAMMLKTNRKIILTGTPIQNHLSELWNLFQFINPGLLGSYEQFQKKYIIPVEQDNDKDKQNMLRRIISPFLLRRTKNEVLEELPNKDEIVLPVELSKSEQTIYEAYRKKAEMLVKEEKTVNINSLAEITRLRQMACSCALVEKDWAQESSKVSTFIELADSIMEGGNHALVFSQFTTFLEEVKQAMDEAKIPYLYLDGSTPIKKRELLVQHFQEGEYPFFLISLKAGGLGLNLTGANYVIHLDPWWNPAIEQQATDRAYRIGQQQDVTVYHLIAQNTIEEKILRLHKTKRDLADSLLAGTDMSHALTKEDLLNLIAEE